MYILLCSNGKFYTGSTKDLELRLKQHQDGNGAKYTKKFQPVKLVYYESFDRIDSAFYREKQIQNWSQKKKLALINRDEKKLKELAQCVNDSHFHMKSSEKSGISAPLDDRLVTDHYNKTKSSNSAPIDDRLATEN